MKYYIISEKGRDNQQSRWTRGDSRTLLRMLDRSPAQQKLTKLIWPKGNYTHKKQLEIMRSREKEYMVTEISVDFDPESQNPLTISNVFEASEFRKLRKTIPKRERE